MRSTKPYMRLLLPGWARYTTPSRPTVRRAISALKRAFSCEITCSRVTATACLGQHRARAATRAQLRGWFMVRLRRPFALLHRQGHDPAVGQAGHDLAAGPRQGGHVL